MKGYNTTLSCWEGRLILLPRMGSLPAAASKWRPSEPWVDCIMCSYPCSTAVSPVCYRPGDNTLQSPHGQYHPDIVTLSILTHWAVRMAHRHYDCNTLLAITAACTLLQACCSHEPLLFMYLLCLTWTDVLREEGARAELSVLDTVLTW